VYGDGRSETIIGQFMADNPGHGIFVATKMGRREPQVADNYNLAKFREWTDRSRRNLGVEQLDLVQLHCPPTAVYSRPEVYDALDTLVAEGVIANYGVSVEKVEEALEAIKHPGVASVQIIFNALRLRPLDAVLPAAAAAGVGILARVPLASGLLSGKYTMDTVFGPDDHRNYNRHGDAFDVGETFSGVDYETGLVAAADFGALVQRTAAGGAAQSVAAGGAAAQDGGANLGAGLTPAQAALVWAIQQPGVTSVIPGARNVAQAHANAAAGRTPALGEAFNAGVQDIYDRYFRAAIHARW
jgi:aryl-alcohol dehydrogenase-like predicted oxidoreductase